MVWQLGPVWSGLCLMTAHHVCCLLLCILPLLQVAGGAKAQDVLAKLDASLKPVEKYGKRRIYV